MTFCVSRKAPELVRPSEPTPSGQLPLANVDESWFLRHNVEVILVFGTGKGKGKDSPSKVLREALAKALVPYYPVAGRLVVDPDNADRLQVALTGEGVPFVEASVDCTLQDVDYIQRPPFMIPKEHLIPHHSDGIPFKLLPVPFMMQVTEFNCGGFTVGIKFVHTMFDGKGAGQFTAAMSEIARGLGEPTINPVWLRESVPGRKCTIPNKSDGSARWWPYLWQNQPVVVPIAKDIALERCTIDLPLNYINRLNDQLTGQLGERCTGFEIAIAKLWQCRTRAIDLQRDDAVVSLAFPVNIRRLLNGVLPSEGIGYYGNCIYAVTIEAGSKWIASASLLDVVRLIKRGKEGVPGKYRRLLEEGEGELVLPKKLLPTYDGLAIVDWRGLGFYDTDYGWGAPDYVVPLNEHPFSFGSAYLVNSPPPMKGIRVIMQSVAREHYEAFLDGMKDCSI